MKERNKKMREIKKRERGIREERMIGERGRERDGGNVLSSCLSRFCVRVFIREPS